MKVEKEVTYSILGSKDSFQVVFSVDGKETNAGIFMANQMMSKKECDVWQQIFDKVIVQIGG
jgi:hypothetical protein